MTTRRQIALAVLLLTVALVGGLVVAVRAQSTDAAGSRPAVSGPPDAPAPASSPTVSGLPVPTTKVPGPPADTVHVADRHRARYGGTYVGWDQLLADGRALPATSRGCRTAWAATTRDDALDWGKASYLCLHQLAGRGFKPQGIAGSGSSTGYRIGDGAAETRDIVLVSSYSSAPQQGLRFPNRPGTDTTRLTVIDLGRARYATIELVKPVGTDGFTALDSHGSGFAWVGQYLYSSSRTALWMYNADDLMRIDGRYVLPAVARWSVRGAGGGLSSLGVDRAAGTATLTSVNYTETGTAWTQSLPLDETGRLRPSSTPAANDLVLTRTFGPGPATVRSRRPTPVPGTNFQGVGAASGYRFLNSSSLMLDGRRHGDNLVIMKKNQAIARFAMPRENVESLYVDYHRRRYVTVTEHGRQFLFWLPLDHLITRAER